MAKAASAHRALPLFYRPLPGPVLFVIAILQVELTAVNLFHQFIQHQPNRASKNGHDKHAEHDHEPPLSDVSLG
ncbi:MAG TPA: hypothetical protein VF800_09310 [Telluria sp.]